ncbi:protein kinase, partial [Myxococcota bacterium]|nr:protein kinase [Myxococcota bacterium]
MRADDGALRDLGRGLGRLRGGRGLLARREHHAARVDDLDAVDDDTETLVQEDVRPKLDPRAHGYALSPAQLVRLREGLRQLAEGLTALHGAGKLHRDIKPSNVMVAKNGRVVVLDFGLVTEMYEEWLIKSTLEGVVCGTVAYMAPEQGAGLVPTPASDWYAVGVMLYEAL